MKKITRKIKCSIVILFALLFLIIGFSKLGVLFSQNKNNTIKFTVKNKILDTSKYMASVGSVQENNLEPIKANNLIPASEIFYEGESVKEISEKLNKKFKGSLTGMGEMYARLSIEKGMDPYLLAAISVHETGFGLSSAALNKYNFGGIMCSGKLCTYNSVEDGVKKYISMVYRNYYSKGLTTPEQMSKKYAASPTWSEKVNAYYKSLKTSN